MKATGILKNTALVGAFTASSRVLGLVREMLQSRLIGAGWEQSAFTLAFAIPNMARKLFGEGALTAAFVPIFKSELECAGREKAEQLARAVMTTLFAMLGAVIVLGVIGLTIALGHAPWGLSDAISIGRTSLVLRLTRVLLPYMLFICGAAFGMGVLNAMGKFAAAALMPCLLNVCWIAALAVLAFAGDMPVRTRALWVAVAILAAGFLQMAFMFWHMHKRGIRPVPSLRGLWAYKTRLVWHNTAIAAMGAGAVQINYMLDQVLGQCASPWAAGVIGYAERLMDLPLGVIGVAFGTVLLPTFAGFFAKGDSQGASVAFCDSARSMLFVMIPAAVGLGVLAPLVTEVIYEGRAFDAVATRRVARAVSCYAVGLGFFGLQKALVPWFQAQHDMKTPLKVSVWAVGLNATLNILAVWLLPVEWKHVGLAASTVICAGASCMWLAGAARRRAGLGSLQGLLKPVARICLASLGMGVAVAAAAQMGRPALPAWANLAICLAIGGVVYFPFIFLLENKRLSWYNMRTFLNKKGR